MSDTQRGLAAFMESEKRKAEAMNLEQRAREIAREECRDWLLWQRADSATRASMQLTLEIAALRLAVEYREHLSEMVCAECGNVKSAHPLDPTRPSTEWPCYPTVFPSCEIVTRLDYERRKEESNG